MIPSHHLMTIVQFNELFQELKGSQQTSCKDEHDLIMGAKYAEVWTTSRASMRFVSSVALAAKCWWV